MNLVKPIITCVCLSVFLLFSCGSDEEPVDMFTDNFDREEMLAGWVDEIIIPAFENYTETLANLVVEKDAFINDQSESNFENLRASYLIAYKAWQRVSMFDIGKAEAIGLRNYSNIFPTDTELINNNIANQSYNLELPSNFDAQGFPALDYLLYGIADTDAAIIALLETSDYELYLDDLISRLQLITADVLTDWRTNYRDMFVNNSGSSGTASVDKLVNDFLFYYEKFLRAGKIGIPAGVFSGNTIVTAVEAPYSKIYSKDLFFEGFEAVQDFFVGKSFDGNSNVSGLESYLLHIEAQNETANISNRILDQWIVVNKAVESLLNDFGDQVITDNSKMLEAYDEMQKAVVVLKVDMMQALNIQVDFVDADGD